MDINKIIELSPTAITWDGFDEAIICLANKEEKSQTAFYTDEGDLLIELDDEYYEDYESSEDEDIYDRWSRDKFSGVIVYDLDKCLEILIKDMEVDIDTLDPSETLEDATYISALEYLEYNIIGAYVGEKTPIYVKTKKIEI